MKMSKSWVVICAATVMVVVTWSQLMSEDSEKVINTRIGDYKMKAAEDMQVQAKARRRPSKGGNAAVAVLAYWILGTRGENKRMKRLLKAIYHPRNHYLLQLDSAASHGERLELLMWARSEKVFEEFGNVDVVGKSYSVNLKGASGLGAMLHAAALLLRIRQDWDWFLPLTTSDYPVLPQDDILYAFGSLPKDVIFMDYNISGSSLEKKVRQIVVDPSVHLTKKTSILYAAETRQKPDAFEIFGGSPWMVLTREFLEHCVNGMDSFPRKLLMYLNNAVFPLESYFQTVLCNSINPHFQNTIFVNSDLRRRHMMMMSSSSSSNTNTTCPSPDDHSPLAIFLQMQSNSRHHDDGDDLSSSIWGYNIDAVHPTLEGIKLQQSFSTLVRDKKLLATTHCKTYAIHHQTTN